MDFSYSGIHRGVGMNDSEIDVFVEKIVKKINATRQPCNLCANEEQRTKHRKDHEFITSLIELADRINNVRWGVATALLKALLIAAVLGGIAFAWRHGIKS